MSVNYDRKTSTVQATAYSTHLENQDNKYLDNVGVRLTNRTWCSSTGGDWHCIHRDKIRACTLCCFGSPSPHLNLLIMGPNNTKNYH